MKKMMALVCALVLCLSSGLALAQGERVLFERAGFSLTVPDGWKYRDHADEINEQGETIMMGEEPMTMLGYIMVGAQSGLPLICFIVMELPEGYDPEAEMALYAEAYADSGEYIEVDGYTGFAYKDENNMKAVLLNTEDKVYSIYGEVFNDAIEQQFDEVVESIDFS